MSSPVGGEAIVAVAFAACVLVAASSPSGSPTDGMRAWPVGYGTATVDERLDPWETVTDATVASRLTPTQRRVHRTRRVTVDYDADGVPDVAWMASNRNQMGVLVRLGATGRTILVYRSDGRWTDQSLSRSGDRSIVITFPESTAVVLSSVSGAPMVYFQDEGGR